MGNISVILVLKEGTQNKFNSGLQIWWYVLEFTAYWRKELLQGVLLMLSITLSPFQSCFCKRGIRSSMNLWMQEQGKTRVFLQWLCYVPLCFADHRLTSDLYLIPHVGLSCLSQLKYLKNGR